MKQNITTHVGLVALALANIALISQSRAAVFAAEVISYTPGTGATLTDPSAALGQPFQTVGEGTGFDGPLTPFNPHFEADQIVQVGEGGQLTLRLSNFAVLSAGFAEIGIFSNVGIIDSDFPNGLAGDPIATFGVDSVTLEFSEDGNSWFSPTDLLLDQPTAFYADTANSSPADFGQSHTNLLNDFAGEDYAGILDLLGGSAGGKWIDIGILPVAQVGFLRFSVADDGDAGTNLTAEIDAISIENRAVGQAIPESSALALLASACLLGLRRRRPFSAK